MRPHASCRARPALRGPVPALQVGALLGAVVRAGAIPVPSACGLGALRALPSPPAPCLPACPRRATKPRAHLLMLPTQRYPGGGRRNKAARGGQEVSRLRRQATHTLRADDACRFCRSGVPGHRRARPPRDAARRQHAPQARAPGYSPFAGTSLPALLTPTVLIRLLAPARSCRTTERRRRG